MRDKIWGIGIILVFISVSFVEAQTEGLILYLPFNEGSGNVARDMSGHDNDGAIIEARWVQGKSGSGLAFNGVDSYVEVPYDKMFNLTETLTLAAWIKPAQSPFRGSPWRCIINARRSLFGPYLLQVCATRGEFGVINNGTWTWIPTNVHLALNEFTHLVGIYESDIGFRGYVNGRLDNWNIAEGSIAENSDEGIVIGHNYSMEGRWFEGIIDEVAIFNRALTGGEVMDLYEGGIREQVTDITSMLKLTTTWGLIKNNDKP